MEVAPPDPVPVSGRGEQAKIRNPKSKIVLDWVFVQALLNLV